MMTDYITFQMKALKRLRFTAYNNRSLLYVFLRKQIQSKSYKRM